GSISGNYTHLSEPFALAFDGNGRLLVADESSGVLVFNAIGNVPPVQHILGFNGADGVMADKNNEIYVADFGSKAIKVFASNATGYATPLRTIEGSKTGLNGPNFLVKQ
ncbi:MAG TPA: hypothetical protein VKE42_12555, partial [Candidatus Cybelea sp.]|nr:hypothetical protein [Candidatus Cybelea sp.]